MGANVSARVAARKQGKSAMALNRVLITWVSVALIAGCAATKQASTVETIGLSRQ